jgi:KRAB domain-containing zinc finger protein
MCPLCHVSTAEMTVHYSVHFRNEHPGWPYKRSVLRFAQKCPQCPFETRSRDLGTMRRHLFTHGLVDKDEVYRYKCKQCKETFRCVGSLETHEHRVHGAPKCAKCDVCGKEFSNRSSMKIHKTDAHSGKKRTCEHCGKELRYLAYFKHRATCRSNGEKKPGKRVLCSICGAVYVTQHGLDSHMANEHGIGEYAPKNKFEAICSDCGSVFKTKAFFLAHMMLEHGKELPGLKKYPCSVCDKVFYTKDYLKSHAMIHTNDMYTCSDCGYQTRFSGNLSKHAIGVHKKRSVAYKPRPKSGK